FLGHPLKCPHGKPIPRGECCTRFSKELKPFVKPLFDLGIGEHGKIVFMSPKTHTRLDRLMTFGITPGSVIKLHQKKPSFVIQIGETDLAIDSEIARNIYVKRVNGEPNNYMNSL
ncbi:FeoA domain-containing protein, partial [candidate division KSB1 bacterium]